MGQIRPAACFLNKALLEQSHTRRVEQLQLSLYGLQSQKYLSNASQEKFANLYNSSINELKY